MTPAEVGFTVFQVVSRREAEDDSRISCCSTVAWVEKVVSKLRLIGVYRRNRSKMVSGVVCKEIGSWKDQLVVSQDIQRDFPAIKYVSI